MTGASSGIGKATAEKLLDRGYTVYAAARRVERMRDLEPLGIDVVVIEPGLITTEFGDVMIGPMLERSGEGPYAELAHAMAAASRESYQPDRSSPPSVIADVVVKALEARRPKTRYAAGRMAKLLIWARKWLGDRIFDRAVTSRI